MKKSPKSNLLNIKILRNQDNLNQQCITGFN